MSNLDGAYYTKKYINVFKECGYTEEEINKKVEESFNKIFYGDEDTRIYYPVGEDMGYLVDTGNIDVRTEGMSYGMMMCVQLDKKEEFDRIWKWTKKYMWHNDGEYKGYFAWSVGLDGIRNAQGPAPDGEEFFAMALFFASHRWGDGQEPCNYSQQARDILKECIHKGEDGIGNPMWDKESKLIKFVPEMEISDPSYHLPHFYELFSLWANEDDREFWAEAAINSRKYLHTACHPVTGLAPEYSYYDGSPYMVHGRENFYSDSYRVAANIGLDYEWFKKDSWQIDEANNIQNFFYNIGFDTEYYQYTLEGKATDVKCMHPVGLLATNAMASLATSESISKVFVEEFWNTPVRTGEKRYYDNCLYMFAILALSGKYRIW